MGGEVRDVSAEVYHEDGVAEVPSLSASIAHLLVNRTPWHAWNAHPKLNPGYERVERDIFDLGNVVHQLVLEGSTERVWVVEAGDWRKKEAQEERATARADGLIPLLRKDYERVRQMVDAVFTQLDARDDDPPLFKAGKPERTLVWEERGVTCRALVDWLHDDYTAIDDLKTVGRTADPTVWGRHSMLDQGCDLQAAFYIRGVRAVTGKTPTFRFLLAETMPPYAISVVSPAPDVLELAELKAERAIGRWRECLEADRWPGYSKGVYYAELPTWAEYDFMAKDAEALTA